MKTQELKKQVFHYRVTKTTSCEKFEFLRTQGKVAVLKSTEAKGLKSCYVARVLTFKIYGGRKTPNFFFILKNIYYFYTTTTFLKVSIGEELQPITIKKLQKRGLMGNRIFSFLYTSIYDIQSHIYLNNPVGFFSQELKKLSEVKR